MEQKNQSLDELSGRLHSGLKEFREMVKSLGANALRRILITAMEFPVEETQKLVGERERIAANVAIDLKAIMTHMAITYLVDKQNEEPVKKTRKTTKKEKSNE